MGRKRNRLLGPAPGYRLWDAGTLLGAGNCGFSWSSTANEALGLYLHFYVTYFHASFLSNRGYGFQLRCLSE
ncbi:hypothetical protein [uncultured Rikenella sp.]|uniref:hypothetical protein n=1 Tax=uncultured Rikenella sp. TaxID=368003 RepID=UPI0025ED65C0|nr:hypothetical protein [uncultured Rikenella sp.]